MRKLLPTKISIPAVDDIIIPRLRFNQKLDAIKSCPVTVITAGAGYGKTTAMIQYWRGKPETPCWYCLGPEDDTLYIFAIYLAGSLDRFYPGFSEWFCQRLATEKKIDWRFVLFLFLSGLNTCQTDRNTPVYLVIDDWQYIHDAGVVTFFDRLLANLPDSLHIMLLSREYVNLPVLERMRLRGKAKDLFPTDLLFSPDEIETLFQKAQLTHLDDKDIQVILKKTEGWAIVIKMLAAQWREDAGQYETYLQKKSLNLQRFFEYLSYDFFNRQSVELQDFMLKTSLVEYFDLDFCQNIIRSGSELKMLHVISQKGLLARQSAHGVYQYHSLFRDFLQQKAEEELSDKQELYQAFIQYYLKKNNYEWALHFCSLCQDWKRASDILSQVGRHWIVSGRQRLFQHYIQKVPVSYRKNPRIFISLGDMARLAGEYEKAVYWYQQSGYLFAAEKDAVGESESYRGLGEIYLDIIQPVEALRYLHQAYKALPEGQEEKKGELLYLMSENMINHGNSRQAERYLALRHRVVPFDHGDRNNLQARIWLRTGKIRNVCQLLQKENLDRFDRMPLSFRDSSLILSLCYSIQGDMDQALQYANKGIQYAQAIHSQFIAVIGYVRMGHALLLDYRHNKEICRQKYEKALALADTLSIERSKTEIYWGQSLMAALDGKWLEAERIGQHALSITQKGKDAWFAAILYLTLGMGAVFCNQAREGLPYLKKALSLYQKCRDTLGQTACFLYFSHCYQQLGLPKLFLQSYQQFLQYSHRYSYEFLLEKPSILGNLGPVTCETLRQYYQALQSVMENEESVNSVVTTFGGLAITSRGRQILSEDWTRKAAKMLFLLLISFYDQPMNRESLMTLLWPDADSRTSRNNFKVTLNCLLNILDPERMPRTSGTFIHKERTSLQFSTSEECYLDVRDFEQFVTRGRVLLAHHTAEGQALLQKGLALYKGDYLCGEVLNEPLLQKRDRLKLLALNGGTELANSYVNQKKYRQSIIWAEWILAIDPCWEEAYRILLISYGIQKDIAMVKQWYRRCCQVLNRELCMPVSEQTEELYRYFTQ